MKFSIKLLLVFPLLLTSLAMAQSANPFTATGPVTDQGGQVFNVAAYGAKGDGQILFDGAMASGSSTLTSVSGKFVAGDVGKFIYVYGAGVSGVFASGTISTYNSATSVSLSFSNSSGGAISGEQFGWGTDNATTLQAAVNAAEAVGGHVYIPPGRYFDSSYLFFKETGPDTVRMSGAAAVTTATNYVNPANLSIGSAIVFTGDPGGVDTPCGNGTGGAVQIGPVSEGLIQEVEIDHLFLDYTNPGLGCVVNASGGQPPLFNIHHVTIQGTMATAAAGQITEGIVIDNGVEDHIDHSVFGNLGGSSIHLIGVLWNVGTINWDLFNQPFDATKYQVDLTGAFTESVDIIGSVFEVGPLGIHTGASKGGRIASNWFGDGVSTTGTWINAYLNGAAIIGNTIHQGFDQVVLATGGVGIVAGNIFDQYGDKALSLPAAQSAFTVNGNIVQGCTSTAVAGIYVPSPSFIDASANSFNCGFGDSYLLDSGAEGLIDYKPGQDNTPSGLVNNSALTAVMRQGTYVNPRLLPQAFSKSAACAAGTEGTTASITDSTTATWGATITGGGTNHVLGYCNGTHWTVAAQ